MFNGFLGLILDNTDVKRQLETFYFSNLPATQDVVQSDDIPEAKIVYSPKENLTTVVINFRVDTKPQDFRLSVIKNLQEHQFRIAEDSGKTILSLTLDYPEVNYPQLSSSANQTKEFHFDIRERSLDFQNAVQKIIPGFVFTPILYSDLQQEEEGTHDYHGTFLDRSSQSPPPPPSSGNTFPKPSNFTTKDVDVRGNPPDPPRPNTDKEIIDYPLNPELETNQDRMVLQNDIISPHNRSKNESQENQDMIDESKIMEDLLLSSPSEPQVTDLSPEDVQQLKNHNKQQLEKHAETSSSSLVTADRVAGVAQEDSNSSVTNENKEGCNEESSNEITDESEAENADSVKIDFTNLNHSTDDKTKLNQFDLDIIHRIEQRTEKATNRGKTNLEIQKEKPRNTST